MLIIWPVNAAYELVHKVLIVLSQDNIFNYFIQLKIFSHMLEKTSLTSYYNLALPIQGILGADLQKLKGKDIYEWTKSLPIVVFQLVDYEGKEIHRKMNHWYSWFREEAFTMKLLSRLKYWKIMYCMCIHENECQSSMLRPPKTLLPKFLFS